MSNFSLIFSWSIDQPSTKKKMKNNYFGEEEGGGEVRQNDIKRLYPFLILYKPLISGTTIVYLYLNLVNMMNSTFCFMLHYWIPTIFVLIYWTSLKKFKKITWIIWFQKNSLNHSLWLNHSNRYLWINIVQSINTTVNT